VLGVLRKLGLEMWFKNNTAQYCDEESKKGKMIGTLCHSLIQNHIAGKPTIIETTFDEEVKNVVHSYIKFRRDYPDIKLEIAELKMTSEKYKVNGTLDCLGVMNDKLVIFDWKTGKTKDGKPPEIYDEYVIQVSAYVNLYNEIYKTCVDEAVIVSLAKNEVKYNTETVNKETIDLAFNNIFLPALTIYNNLKELKRLRIK
jgi:ATP-dependent exoDNAse (exonuclease V) beta subunit